jgi:heat-inducible transcriptional repressor
MESRKHKILSVIIEKYIETGEPIGSKSVCDILNSKISPATARSEMAKLSFLGYLNQPHTSAGRIPSAKGYRYYINRLMQETVLSLEEEKYISENFYSVSDIPEKLVEKATELLAEITNFIAISTMPSNHEARIQNIEFVQIGLKTAMMILITDTGLVKNLIFRCGYDLTPQILNVFRGVLIEKFCGKLLVSITPEFVDIMADLKSNISFLLTPAINALINAAKGAEILEINIKGQNNLKNFSDLDFRDILQLFEFLEDKQNILDCFFSKNQDITINIGRENNCRQLENLSTIGTKYAIGTKNGIIGLICPIRANYAKLTSILKYISLALGNFLEKIAEVKI